MSFSLEQRDEFRDRSGSRPVAPASRAVLLLDNDGRIVRSNLAYASERLRSLDFCDGTELHSALHPCCDGSGCALAEAWQEAWSARRNGNAVEWDTAALGLDSVYNICLLPARQLLTLLFGESTEDFDGCTMVFVEDARDKYGFFDRRSRYVGKKRETHEHPAAAAKRRATDQISVLNQRLNTVTGRLLLAQQKERDRIAADIHDSLGQTLSLMNLEVEDPRDEVRREDMSASQMRLRRYIQQSLIELRRITRDLTPVALDKHGLIGALNLLCMDFRAACPNVALDCHFSESVNKLSEGPAIAAYRIAQEALNNVVKHAHASAALVSFTIDDTQIELLIRDNGTGLPQQLPSGGFGLKTMRERAHSSGGSFVIESDPHDGGCVVRTCWAP